MKKMISFLGTTPYMECHYFKDHFTSTETRFIQTALYEMLIKEGVQIDKVYVFVTDEALKKNYEDYYDEQKDVQYIGLKNVWNDKFGDEGAQLIPVHMEASLMEDLEQFPRDEITNKFEEEQWDLFNKIYEIIEENDEIYFDITHSFRSNPVIALIIANFAKTMKNAKLNRLFYGNFEALGPAWKVATIQVEKRHAPIVDITSMMELLDWTIGVDTFLRTGNLEQIFDLADDKSRFYHKDPGYHAIRNFSGALNNLNMHIETVRGPEINEKVIKVLDNYPKLEKHKTGVFPQFEKLIEKIEDKLSYFSHDEIENALGSVIWAFKHGLYQQSITLLEEHIISIIAKKLGVDTLDKDNRMIISQLLQQKIKEPSNEESEKDKGNENAIKDLDELEKFLDELIKTYPELKAFEKLATLRNDVNHAGLRKNYKKPETIIKNIEEYIEELKTFFEKAMEKTE